MISEEFLRVATFLIVLLLTGLWEIVAPRRPLTVNKGVRWLTNLSMIFITNLLVRFTLPLLPDRKSVV